MDQDGRTYHMIARSSNEKYISYSRRGLVRIHWGLFTIQLSARDFVKLAVLMEQSDDGHEQVSRLDWPVRIRKLDFGCFAIRIHDTRLELDPGDYSVLKELVLKAIQRIGCA